MLFPETVVFDFALLKLEEELSDYAPPIAKPLPCDRWIARSGLQKAIRRSQTDVALRAFATLLAQDRRAVWRHLIVIALEDVGVPELRTVQQVIAAGRSHPWRQRHGGDWPVGSFLVRRMCESSHCQAACDLLLRVLNSPSLEEERASAFVADRDELIVQLTDKEAPIETRAVAGLALGSGLGEEKPSGDAALVFGFLFDAQNSAAAIATCSAAWTTSRNPMALLLPLVWQQWIASGTVHTVRDDLLPPCRLLGEIPEYALDQFTRLGLQVARTYVAQDPVMRSFLDQAEVPRSQQSRCVADLLFLIEGGLVRRRAIWSDAEHLRMPFRALPGAVGLGHMREDAISRLKSKLGEVRKLRLQYLQPGTGTRRS